ncbi:MAG: tetratricopeptide repeat protein, partial [Gammaproteobacteria bacterium]
MNDGQDELRLSARATDQAEALMDLGRYEQAIPLLSNSLAQSPDDERLHCRLADAYFSLHDYTQAESFAQRALHLDPNSAHA